MKASLKKTAQRISTWALVACGVALVLAAGFHRVQLDIAMPDPYISSPLIAIEIALILIMCLMLIMHVLRLIYLILKKRWRDFGILAVKTAVGIACIIAALQIDAPTLLYRT